MSRGHIFVLALLLGASACSKSMSVGTPEAPEPAPAPAAAVEPPATAEVAPVEDPSDVRIVGDHIEFDEKIHFATNSDEILADSNGMLDHIAQALKNHGEFTKLHVVGHTDKTGKKDHNQDLSERRAAAVVAALESRGVTQAMDARGAGEDEPTCTEDTDECHEKNRRVELIVEP